jgi:hypothetical protein
MCFEKEQNLGKDKTTHLWFFYKTLSFTWARHDLFFYTLQAVGPDPITAALNKRHATVSFWELIFFDQNFN